MTVRVEVVTPCKHGQAAWCGVSFLACPGGRRRLFTEWPLEAIVEMARFDFEGEGDVVSWDRLSPRGREIRIERMARVAGILWDRITS